MENVQKNLYLAEQQLRAALNLIHRNPTVAESLILHARTIKEIEPRIVHYKRLIQHLLDQYKYVYPDVSPEEFLLGKYYLNLGDEVYPEVLKEFIKINSGDYTEAVLTGAIGTAKTTLALWTNAYQLFQLSRLRQPQREFNLDSSSEIVFVFQSISGKQAKVVDFDRFRHLIERSKYFNERFPYDKYYLSELKFPKRVYVRPVGGTSTAAIGQNVFGGLLDEVNYMAVVEKSAQAVDKGLYDQAIELYNSLARRRKSRFMKKGKVPGIFCIVSSKRYPGQFTDQKEKESLEELAKTGKTSIYVYDKRTWEVLPSDRFSGKWFKVFIGDLSRKPRVLQPNEKVAESDKNLVMDVPEEYRVEFEKDIFNALREIGGVSTLARYPFLMNAEAVTACFAKRKSILNCTEVDFATQKVGIIPTLIEDRTKPRFVHIDLGVTGDAAGVVMGYVPEFVKINRGKDLQELLPRIAIDFTLRVVPPKGGEILFYKIRDLLYKLRDDLKINVRWVSFDSFQSTDSLQILRQKGFITGVVSVDADTLAYDIAKTALYDARIDLPEDQHLKKELMSLERDQKTNKIDHPPNGSKDVADALAGVVHGLTMRREIWAMYGISPASVPQSLVTKMHQLESKLKAA